MRQLLQLTRSRGGWAQRSARGLLVPLLLIVGVTGTACGGVDRVDDAADVTPEGGEIAAPQAPTAIAIAKSPTPTPTPTPTPSWNVDADTIDALLDQEDGVYGVVLMSERGDILYSRNADTPFITASVYKVVVLTDILRRVEQGELSLDEELTVEEDVFPVAGEESDTYFGFDEIGTDYTVRELLYAMGAYSSNVAARTLLKQTDPASLTATAQDIGMDRTYILTDLEDIDFWPPTPAAGGPPGNAEQAIDFVEQAGEDNGEINVTTPFDMATFLLGVLNGQTVSPYVSDQILSILLQNRIDDRIPHLLDDGYAVANKPGNLDHVTNDIGIIYAQAGPRIVVTLTEDTTWDGRAREAIQRIALVATGETDFPPIPDEAMEDGYGPSIDWGEPDDPRDVIADPPEPAS